jgi:hypothetical protein
MKRDTLTHLFLVAAVLFLLGKDLLETRQVGVREAAAASGQILSQASNSIASGGYISIPAAAFHPKAPGYNYANFGSALYGDSPGLFVAPLYLPHGAQLTRITFFWNDTDSDPLADGGITVMRSGFFGVESPMAVLTTTGSGQDSTTTTTIDHATINNSQYQYHIQADLPDWGASGRVTLFCVVIEYNFPVYMPIVVK